MKTPALIALCLCIAPQITYADSVLVDASTAHATLSGAQYTCTLGEIKFDMLFKDVEDEFQAFPYEFRAGESSSEDAYLLTETGDIHLQSAEAVRFLSVDGATLNIAKTPDGRAATCTRM
ncbi:MAG: hypothetical protein GY883_21770 [Shimia sp.]|nr:hypothetical protein [Shimia sp.]